MAAPPSDPSVPDPHSRDPEPALTPSRLDPGRTEKLAAIARVLSSATAVREELADDIQAQINRDAYMSDEKLELAIYRMLKDILN